MSAPHPPSEVERGLTALVLCDGNARRAEEELRASGKAISRSTLNYWRKEKADELDRISHELAPKLREIRAQALDDLAHAGVEVSRDGLALLHAKLPELDPRDLGGAIRNAATVVGIATEKAALLRDQPTSVIQHDYTAAMNFLRRKNLIIEGTAEEIPAET